MNHHSVTVDSIPVRFTPPGGWTVWPAPILEGCTEPRPVDAADVKATISHGATSVIPPTSNTSHPLPPSPLTLATSLMSLVYTQSEEPNNAELPIPAHDSPSS